MAVCKSAAAATRTAFFCAKFADAKQLTASIASNDGPNIFLRAILPMICAAWSDSQNHDFRGLDQCRCPFARLQSHFLSGVRGDNRGDVLFANRQRDLRKNSAVLDGHYSTNQLIAPADPAKLAAPRTNLSALQLFWNQPVDFAFRYAVVSARSLGGLY